MKNMTKICFISDLHGSYTDLVIPESDIIVCAGDMTNLGYKQELLGFFDWFSNLPQAHKIFVAGNHDFIFEKYPVEIKELIPSNIIYLEDSGVEIMGLNFYGTPVQVFFNNWAFNRTEKQLEEYWKKIPENTDILITHSPPFGIMDLSKRGNNKCGSKSLLYEVIYRIKPKIHVFGHIHEGYGVVNKDDIIFINASNMDMDYNLTNPPIIIEI